MAEPETTARASSPPAGVPPGLLDAILGCLRTSEDPVRRRKLLEELERRGHRVSLAGLNRALQHCQERKLTLESPDGVRLRKAEP
ncbi:MAG: hypothetical protein L3K00_01495 [Thermoplasmata archaeon]|nr:hypothetical protein [Thermoplasmata archaeon]